MHTILDTSNKDDRIKTVKKKGILNEEDKKMKKMMSIAVAAVAGLMVMGTAGTVFADVTVDDAKKTALEAVGVKEDQVIFEVAAESTDDGVKIIEVEFFVPGEVKYEFDIDAATGAILEQDMDLWEAEDDVEYAALIKSGGLESIASAVEAAGEITELQAKAIALKDAGLGVDDVTFVKCKKDVDDGVTKFEVEFVTKDGIEYDFDISVKDGTILEKSAEAEDD
jgi:uncharacterized membrane protein YkoI